MHLFYPKSNSSFEQSSYIKLVHHMDMMWPYATSFHENRSKSLLTIVIITKKCHQQESIQHSDSRVITHCTLTHYTITAVNIYLLAW